MAGRAVLSTCDDMGAPHAGVTASQAMSCPAHNWPSRTPLRRALSLQQHTAMAAMYLCTSEFVWACARGAADRRIHCLARLG